jgi:tetrahydromethanopterin S-methyltransferase subunit E
MPKWVHQFSIVVIMSYLELPSSYSLTIVSFAIFFFSINAYILTLLIDHPFASPLWLVGVVVGLIALVYSYRMVQHQQRELIEEKERHPSEP